MDSVTGVVLEVLEIHQRGFGEVVVGQFEVPELGGDHRLGARRPRARLETRGQSDIYAVDNKFPPGATTGWHSHPGPSLILVIAGTVTNYSSDDPACRGLAQRRARRASA